MLKFFASAVFFLLYAGLLVGLAVSMFLLGAVGETMVWLDKTFRK